jgi:hypothetical protein
MGVTKEYKNPVARFEIGRRWDGTCYTLNKATRAGASAIVLETVDNFVYQNTADLVCATVGAVDDMLA